jgi:AraC-like DNA-binding protein
MYSPVKDGIDKSAKLVHYSEAKPSSYLSEFVDCFWELKTNSVLVEDFSLHALPDACINILFNQKDTEIAGITALQTKYEILNLGKSFHYVGIQLLPGVWQGDRNEISNKFVGTPYVGNLPLIEMSKKMARLNFFSKQKILSELVTQLVNENLIIPNPLTKEILLNLDSIHSVTDMAAIVNLSARQLQRTLKKTTGFSPHDLLKVLRLQKSFNRSYLVSYADQSHFIHAFKEATGYTPVKYIKKFDV